MLVLVYDFTDIALVLPFSAKSKYFSAEKWIKRKKVQRGPSPLDFFQAEEAKETSPRFLIFYFFFASSFSNAMASVCQASTAHLTRTGILAMFFR